MKYAAVYAFILCNKECFELSRVSVSMSVNSAINHCTPLFVDAIVCSGIVCIDTHTHVHERESADPAYRTIHFCICMPFLS